MDTFQLAASIKDRARQLGFELAGICRPSAPAGWQPFQDWLAAGYAGEMHYLSARREAYRHPRHLLAGLRSMVMLGMPYRTREPAPSRAGQGRVSRYAWGQDYHLVIRDRLHQLADFLRQLVPGAATRGVVDTAPLAEREFAQLAGLGWVGKNTLLLNRHLGSWFFLAALLTDVELAADPPHATDHCGTCRACLDACPTGAFVEPYVLDSRRCISYLTIELKGTVPPALRRGLGDWVFGCDVCQDVCPWNQRAGAASELAFQPVGGMNPLELAALFDLDEAGFRARFRHTPLWRPKRRGLLRNAALVLGNRPAPGAVPALVKGLNDSEPLVRAACAWALARQGGDAAAAALRARAPLERDAQVASEIEQALASLLPAADAPARAPG